MSIKGKKKIILLVISVLAILIFYGIYSFTKTPLMEFSFKQEKSHQEDFMKSTIIFNSQQYVCDYDEFCLKLLDNKWNKVIARDKNGSRIYSIKGQDDYNYIMFLDYGEMQIPTIFRKASIPSVNYSNMKFNKIRIYNKEYNVTNEIAEDIIKGIGQIRNSKLTIKPQEVYGLDLIWPNLKGLGYSIDVYVYNNELYFASRGYDKCVKASDNFSNWLKAPIK